MRTSILSILIALTVVVAGPLAFAAGDQNTDQETVSETLSETVVVTEVSEAAENMETEGAKEDCTNSVDDDGDTIIDCEDSDCAEDPGCKDGY